MHRFQRCIRLFAIASMIIVAALAGQPAHAEDTGQTITVDGQGTGRTFAGVGAISGGGGTSRLITDYAPAQRAQILNYLFSPGYGADLQILKVEIGSDTNSSNGAEAGHMRSRTDLDCNRGYEWWLMEQAKERDPGIQLYGLEWGAPGWFTGGFWSNDNITYLLNWLGCARQHHLTINYLGGWNEKGWDATWYENLRAALDSHGYGYVKLVAADNAGWDVATDMATDPAFNAATQVVGIHYPCTEIKCTGNPTAIALGKPLFASESGWNNYLTGADRLAAEMNHEYIDAKITGFINWPAAYAWYPSIQMQGSGLLEANEPWSGHYELGPTLWTIAQTAQFTRPGWRYIDSASGYLDGGGTYVTLRSQQGRPDYSTVFETTAATAAQTVTLHVTGGLPAGRLHVWSTTLDSTNSADWFDNGPDLKPDGSTGIAGSADGTWTAGSAGGGDYTLTLQPGRVYTVTTMTGGKGRAVAPASAVQKLPYGDSFDEYAPGATPKYFSDMEGAFDVARCTGGERGDCLRQVITTEPIKWTKVPSPVTLVGDTRWTDYQVSTKAMLEQPGTVSLLGRVVNELNSNKPPHLNIWEAYYLNVSDTGAWSVDVVQASGTTRVLASGQTTAFGTGRWHKLSLTFDGSDITASVDGTRLADVTDSTFGNGQVGLMLDNYINAQFKDFSVTPVAES